MCPFPMCIETRHYLHTRTGPYDSERYIYLQPRYITYKSHITYKSTPLYYCTHDGSTLTDNSY